MHFMVYCIIQSLMLSSMYYVRNVEGCRATVLSISSEGDGVTASMDDQTASITFEETVENPEYWGGYVDPESYEFMAFEGTLCDQGSGKESAKAVIAELLSLVLGMEDCSKIQGGTDYSGPVSFETNCGELQQYLGQNQSFTFACLIKGAGSNVVIQMNLAP